MTTANRDHGATTMSDQGPLLAEFLTRDGPRWLLWCDGFRADTFEQLYEDYLTGNYQSVHNGGYGYTGDWTEQMLDGDYPELGFFSPVPLWGFEAADYDERDHFGFVPDPGEYDDSDIQDRLAALGYVDAPEGVDDTTGRQPPEAINSVVREHMDSIRGGVVRYVHPHPPLLGLEDLTSGTGKIDRVEDAIESGDVSHQDLRNAYRRTAEVALRGVQDLVPDLDGEIVVTADHGECLGDCSGPQIFHARAHDNHSHLCTVPWFRVDSIVV